MSHTLVLTPDARADIDDARDWYENQHTGRGDDFVDELHDRLEEVRQAPKTFGRVRGQTRAAQLPHSRFIIYYRLDGNLIVVKAVQHASADPRKWQRRK